MNPSIVLLLVGGLYALLFGGMSLLKREGLSIRFAIETILFTAIAAVLSALLAVQIHPVLFLVVLYLITMRVRLLVDLANSYARRGKLSSAQRLYSLALNIWPDESGRLIAQVNQGTALLQEGKLDDAISKLLEVLQGVDQGHLGIKYEAAAHYNLAVAYVRLEKWAQATAEYNAVLDTWPASEYARRAAAALEKHRPKSHSATDERSS